MTGYGVSHVRRRQGEGRGAAAHKRSGVPPQVRYDECDTERDTCDVTLRDTTTDGGGNRW